MMTKFLQITLFTLLTFASSFNNAQQFKSTVDKTIVGENERFSVEFTFSGKKLDLVQSFNPPVFKGFRVLTGPNRQTNMQYINGVVSNSLTFSYILTGTKQGTFTIGKASILYDGKKYESQTINIKVIKGSSSSSSPSNSGGISNEDLAKSVFIIGSVDKKKVYLGEQVTLTYKFYTKLRIATPQIDKFPTYNGFWSVDLDMSNALQFIPEMYKNERFNVAIIKKVALFPTKEGKLEISPFSLDVPVITTRKRKTGDVFERFFNDSFFNTTETIDYTAKSNVVSLIVKELPKKDVPKSFNGLVGDYSLTASIDKKNVKQNEAISLKFNVEGSGNISLLSLPEPELPPGFEKYDPKTTEKINKANKISGRKIIEYLIVPRIPGSKTIKPIDFTFFSPTKKKYVTISTPSFSINVESSGTNLIANQGTYSKEDVKLLTQDIRFIKTSNYEFNKRENLTLIASWFWYVLTLPLIGLGLIIGIRKKQDKLAGNQELFKFYNADKVSKKRFKSAKKILDNKDLENFYSELSQGLFGYLEDKLGISKSSFTLNLAVELLKHKNVSDEILNELSYVSEQCEFVRFAPSNKSIENANSLYNKSLKIITDLEKQLSSKKKK